MKNSTAAHDRRKSSEWFRRLIESTAEPVTVVSVGSGRFVDVNSAFYRNTGFKRQEIIGKTPAEIGFLDDHPAYDRLLRGGSAENISEVRFRTRDGESRLAQISRMAIEVAGQACLILIWRDITECKQFENDMVRARDLALESAQLKSEFLSTVSHELRTPLNGIIGMSQLLSQMTLTAEQRVYADTIEKSSEILLELVGDILDFSKASNYQIRLEEIDFDLRDVVEAAVTLYTARAARKGLELISSIDPALPKRLRGDPHRLGQVLTNLLNNAVKFTESGSVTVRVVPEKLGSDATVVRFEIHDTGIGISPANQGRVFDPFVQADGSTAREYGGTGLGLAICTRLVTLMGGDLGVLSTLGAGSVFHFTAHFAMAHGESDRRGSGAPPYTPQLAMVAPHSSGLSRPDPEIPRYAAAVEAGRNSRILVVEDISANRMVVTYMLGKLGYVVDHVANGFEAVEATARKAFDLVLMDCRMPIMDGYEATRQIRQREGVGPHIKIVAMTAHALSGDEQRCLDAGMDDYLSKPIEMEQLAAVLDRVLPDQAKAGCAAASAADLPSDGDRPQSAQEPALDALMMASLRAQDGLLGSLIEAVLKEVPELLQQVTAGIERANGETAAIAAHSLKSTAGIFGARRMQNSAQTIERAADTDSMENARSELERLRTESSQVLRELEMERSRPAASMKGAAAV